MRSSGAADPAAPEFIAFWRRDARMVGGMNVSVCDVSDPIEALIRTCAPVDCGRLADSDIPLAELSGSGPA
jgi:3-phenylpropionate/trans-cinnamate dioxygenase ferredoxin reductase subunit